MLGGDYYDTEGEGTSSAIPKRLSRGTQSALRQAAINVDVMPQGINNAWDAFCVIVANGPLEVLTKEDHEFSRARTLRSVLIDLAWPSKAAKLAVSLVLGTAACVFFWTPGGKAAVEIANIIHLSDVPGIGVALKYSLKLAMQIVGAGENMALTTYTTKMILDDLTRREPNSESRKAKSYLKYKDLTILNRLALKLRGAFNHAASFGAISTIFYITYLDFANLSPYAQWTIALLAAGSNYGPYVAGTAGIPLKPSGLEPARKALMKFINEQMNRFLRLSPEIQAEMFDVFQQVDPQEILDGKAEMQSAIAMLFNIAAEASERLRDEAPGALIYQPKSRLVYTIIETLAGGFTGLGSWGYTKASYDSGSKISSSIPAIGIVPVLLSIIPTIGLGFLGGKNTANMITTDDKSLAKKYAPKISIFLRLTILACSPFAGGTNFYLNYAAMQTVAGALLGALGVGSGVINTMALASGINGLISASSVNSSFTVKMFDSILLYIADQIGDVEIRRLIQYQAAMRDIYDIIGKMTSDNFHELLAAMLEPGDQDREVGTSDSTTHAQPNLRALVLDILLSQLNEKQFKDLRTKVGNVLPSPEQAQNIQPVPYIEEPSKLACCGLFGSSTGLRRRRPHRFNEGRVLGPDYGTAGTRQKRGVIKPLPYQT